RCIGNIRDDREGIGIEPSAPVATHCTSSGDDRGETGRMDIGEILRVHSIREVEAWLDVHGTSAREIWVLLYKQGSGKQTVTYDQLVDVALCYGWIDGLVKSVDAQSYVQR